MMMITVSVHFCNVLKKLNMLNLIFTCLHWAPQVLSDFVVLHSSGFSNIWLNSYSLYGLLTCGIITINFIVF